MRGAAAVIYVRTVRLIAGHDARSALLRENRLGDNRRSAVGTVNRNLISTEITVYASSEIIRIIRDRVFPLKDFADAVSGRQVLIIIIKITDNLLNFIFNFVRKFEAL